jgi:hypothetical protein
VTTPTLTSSHAHDRSHLARRDERFAGADPSTAVFYPEDDAFLVRRDLTVDHYDVAARRPGTGGATPF